MRKILFIILLITTSFSFGQYIGTNPNSGKGIPFFNFDIYRVYQINGAYVVAVSEIMYDDLTFEYRNGEYVAQYDINVFIQDEDGEINLGYITRHYEIVLDDFEETNSREIKDRRSFEFSIKSGDYQLVAMATDLNNGKKVKRTIETSIEDINDNDILVSDIAFYELDPVSGERLITIGNNFDRSKKEIWAHVTITARSAEEPIEVLIEYAESAFNKNQIQDTLLAPSQLVEFWHLVDLSRAQQSKNSLRIRAIQDGEEHESSRDITFFWSETPHTQSDIEHALKQMIYVASEDSIDHFLGLGKTEQIAYFERFWQSVDPTPKTKRNELKEEYFDRVNISNRAYTFFKNQGCFTDRGRIFIKFGPPDEIDRHPFEDYSMPYEVWSYHALKKVFLFVDTNGIGEYRLDPDYYIYEFN